jgi:hypothetical protein
VIAKEPPTAEIESDKSQAPVGHSDAGCARREFDRTDISRTLLSMARRIALTSIELGNIVGAHWSELRAQALIFEVTHYTERRIPRHSRTCE